jgi:hypothetical protein
MANEPNKQWFRYVSDAGVNFAIQADQDWGVSANSGLTAFNTTDPAWGPQSRMHRLRHAIYIDPATFRIKKVPVGTTAAFAALPATLSVQLPGSVTAETYNLAQRIGEKMRIPRVSRNLPDRAG